MSLGLDFDVVDLPPTDHVAVGDRAPDFERPLATDEHWADVSLSELIDEGPVVLIFHPMVGSFPATYVWQEVADREWTDRVSVVGVAVSTPYAHVGFLRDRGLDGRLYSDPANGVAETYGIGHDLDGMAGVAEPRPAVFVVDADRRVTYAWVADEWPAFPDYDAVERAIDDL